MSRPVLVQKNVPHHVLKITTQGTSCTVKMYLPVTSGCAQAATVCEPPPLPLDQTQNWSVRTLCLSDQQHDTNGTSSAGWRTTQPPRASVQVGEDSRSKDASGQPGRSAVRGGLCAENWSFHWNIKKKGNGLTPTPCHPTPRKQDDKNRTQIQKGNSTF